MGATEAKEQKPHGAAPLALGAKQRPKSHPPDRTKANLSNAQCNCEKNTDPTTAVKVL